ncbi:MAG: ureidoglycolate lyase [Janthinobacterium lividum]
MSASAEPSRLLLRPVPLTDEAFAPFGTVLAHDAGTARSVNAGTAWRTDVGGLEERDGEGVMAIYRLDPQVLPLAVDLFERHPRSEQTFAALSVERFLVVVAPSGPDGLPDPAGVRAFLGRRGAALRYARGQWHAPMIALDAGGDMLMISFERRDGGDTVEHRLAAPLFVTD